MSKGKVASIESSSAVAVVVVLVSLLFVTLVNGQCTNLINFDDINCLASGGSTVNTTNYHQMNINAMNCVNSTGYGKIYYNNTGLAKMISFPNVAYKGAGTITITKTDGGLFDYVDGCYGDVYMKNGTLVTITGYSPTNGNKTVSFVADCTEPKWVVTNWRDLLRVSIVITDYGRINAEVCGPATRSNFLTLDNLCMGGNSQNNPCPALTTVKGDSAPVTTNNPTTQTPTTSPLTTQEITSNQIPGTSAEISTSKLTTADVTSNGMSTSPVTSSKLTTAELTTQELTTNEFTTNELTTQELTTQELTTNELTTQELTTQELTTQELTTQELTTNEFTTNELTTQELTTQELTTNELTTQELTTQELTTQELTTQELTTQELTTQELTTQELTTQELTTNEFTTNELTTQELTTQELTTQELTTQELTTQELTTQELTTQELTTQELTTQELTTQELTTQELTTQELTTQELTTQELTTQELTTQELTTSKLTTASLTTSEVTTAPLTTSALTTSAESDECLDSSDCQDQGICEDSGYCSCLSGFGGITCKDKPQFACLDAYTELNSNAARFKPEVGVSFESSIVKIIIKAPLESTVYENPSNSDHTLVASNQVYSLDTTIKFIGSEEDENGNDCDYPKGPIENEFSWNKPYASNTYEEEKICSDIYELNLPWSLFRSSCDIQKINTNVFSQSIEISRNYAVPFESDYVTRTETLRRNIEFRFPDSVDVSSNVGVVAPSTISVSAIASVKYNIQNDKWSVTIVTDTIRPFRLTAPVVSTDASTQERIGTVSLVPSQSQETRQNIVVEVESCESVNSVFTVSLTAECYIPSECVPENDRSVVITVTVGTGNSCPLVHTIALSTSSLMSFSDSSLTQTQGIFNSNSLAYFTANIDSDEASITSKQLQNVCISLNSGTCNSVSFSSLATQSSNPSFSISLASLNGLAQDGDVVTVNVRVGIEWQDTNKRSIQNFDVALKSRLLIRDNNNVNAQSQPQSTNSGISQRFSIITLLISISFYCLINFVF